MYYYHQNIRSDSEPNLVLTILHNTNLEMVTMVHKIMLRILKITNCLNKKALRMMIVQKQQNLLIPHN